MFPIKIDEVPERKEWRYVPEHERECSPSVFRPASEMGPQVIEQPIEIRPDHAPTTTTTKVKTPSELPPAR